MKEFKMFWNYYKRKNGEIVIDQSEMEAMIAQAYESGYNSGLVEGMKAGKQVTVSKTEAVGNPQPQSHEMTSSTVVKNADAEDTVAEPAMPEPEAGPDLSDFAIPEGMDFEDELPM